MAVTITQKGRYFKAESDATTISAAVTELIEALNNEGVLFEHVLIIDPTNKIAVYHK